MQRIIIGTAGHIDHGKTRLLEALTGIDCDRWAEEKARGITIDLGFAHLEVDDLQIGFIDVPGHERFLHNALAGLGGIRLVLLVVAADEGVKPQTREHLAICTLLGIPHAIVALTKRDLVDEDLLTLAQLEVEELLATTPFAGAPVLPVSSTSGDGIEALRSALVERATAVVETPDLALPLRLPIDRAFQLRGLGSVVTGTLISGTVTAGDTVQVLPADETARVRSVQVHGTTRERAEAGERTALQLTAIDFDRLDRGGQLTTPDHLAAHKTLCARFTLLPDAPEPITSFVPVRFHLYADEVIGKLRPLAGTPLAPGESGLVEIRLSRPTVAVRGDRFIVRRPSPAATLGGGVILDPAWRRRRGRPLEEACKAIVDPERALLLWVFETGERGATATALAPRLGCTTATVTTRLGALTQAGKVLRVEAGQGPRWISTVVCQRVIERGRQLLKRYFQDARLARGMPKAQLLEGLLPRRAADLADIYLDWLQAAGVLVRDGGLVNQPGRTAQLTDEESNLTRTVLERLEAADLAPPSPGDLAAELNAKRQILEGVLRYLLERNKLSRLPTGLLIATSAIDTLRQALHDEDWEQFTVGRFKDRFELSRKWAIPLLEHLDSIGVTRRLGDKRQLIRRQS